MENRHFAVVVADVVLGLAPTVGAHAHAGNAKQHQNDDEYGDDAVAEFARPFRLTFLDMFVANRLGDFRIVRIGGNTPVALLHNRNFPGIGIDTVAIVFADRRRLRDALFRLFRLLVGILAAAQGRGTRRRRLFAFAQRRGGSDRFVDDVRDGFQACAGRAADQRRLMRQVERVRVERERRVGDHRGDVVGAARTQRHRYEPLRALLLIGAGGQHFFKRGIFQHAAQAVGAQQPTVARMRLADGDVRARIDVEIAQHAHHHIALRMVARLGLADTAGVDEMLHVAVVAGHADQMTVVQQIRAGIADMRQYPAAGDQRHGRDGGAHAGKTTLTFGFADDRVVRGHDGSRHHMGDDLHVAVNIVLFDVRQRPDGDGGGGVAAGMPAHAVADGDEMFAGERGILVVGTHGAHVGDDGGIHEQLLRSGGSRQKRHLNSKVVAPMRTGTRAPRIIGAFRR